MSYRYRTLSVEDLPAENANIASVESQHLDLSHHEKLSAGSTIEGNIKIESITVCMAEGYKGTYSR